jgi:hypothetical protein
MTACEELADSETAKPPFHEKRGPRPKIATMERRKARHPSGGIPPREGGRLREKEGGCLKEN